MEGSQSSARGRSGLLRRVSIKGWHRPRPDAGRVTDVFDGVTSGTVGSLGCPAGSRVFEQRALLDDADDLAERAACAEPLR